MDWKKLRYVILRFKAKMYSGVFFEALPTFSEDSRFPKLTRIAAWVMVCEDPRVLL